ncbi:MAG: chromate transporter [Clostridia bacterium]|nr:chromate transporter [Clostridia bacterium]
MFFIMFKIGLFTFGGGYAMIALLQNEFVSKRNWIDKDEFLDMVAIAESTPGPIAINSSTYLGYRRAGVIGSTLGTLGVVLPSFIIIFIISLFFDAFLSLKYVAYAFRGIQVCVTFLILSAGLKMLKGLKKTPMNLCLLGGVVVAMVLMSLLAVNFSSIFYILICGAIGLFVYLLTGLRKADDKSGKEETK